MNSFSLDSKLEGWQICHSCFCTAHLSSEMEIIMGSCKLLSTIYIYARKVKSTSKELVILMLYRYGDLVSNLFYATDLG